MSIRPEPGACLARTLGWLSPPNVRDRAALCGHWDLLALTRHRRRLRVHLGRVAAADAPRVRKSRSRSSEGEDVALGRIYRLITVTRQAKQQVVEGSAGGSPFDLSCAALSRHDRRRGMPAVLRACPSRRPLESPGEGPREPSRVAWPTRSERGSRGASRAAYATAAAERRRHAVARESRSEFRESGKAPPDPAPVNLEAFDPIAPGVESRLWILTRISRL